MSWEKNFGEQVRRIRKARGMSQEDLARALAGTSVPRHQSTIAKLEAASRPLRLNEACDIATALGADLSSMLGVVANPDATAMAYLTRIAELERAVAVAQRALAKVGGAK
ncbi:hypothetical protein GCM10023196_036050 [Actinoallomurus vinaceus]|uniref:HTH cro/C1-type domain-containing protein n=1 Tax=Actinoallomurus vinaceus TaxID=1080074 RepID=A0ABP8UBQ3_9ACTN